MQLRRQAVQRAGPDVVRHDDAGELGVLEAGELLWDEAPAGEARESKELGGRRQGHCPPAHAARPAQAQGLPR